MRANGACKTTRSSVRSTRVSSRAAQSREPDRWGLRHIALRVLGEVRASGRPSREPMGRRGISTSVSWAIGFRTCTNVCIGERTEHSREAELGSEGRWAVVSPGHRPDGCRERTRSSSKRWFTVRRKPIAKRKRWKLAEIRETLRRWRHAPLGLQGRWLGQVYRGWLQHYAVPGTGPELHQFRKQILRRWRRQLHRRTGSTTPELGSMESTFARGDEPDSGPPGAFTP